MIRNPHTLEDSWWDGPEYFQYVNRNVVAGIQTNDMCEYLKAFAPKGIGIDIGGSIDKEEDRALAEYVQDKLLADKGKGRSSFRFDSKPYILKVNISGECDIQARAENLPFLDESIAFIVSIHTVEHIKGDLRETFKEWFRVLVPNGLLGIVMPDKRHFLHDPKQTKEGVAAYRELEPNELLELFSGLSMKVLLFDSRKNNFDFDLIVRKVRR